MSTTLFFNAKVHISYTHDKIIDMKKINTAPLSGMQELSPTTQALFNQLKQNIIDTYHSYGFTRNVTKESLTATFRKVGESRNHPSL